MVSLLHMVIPLYSKIPLLPLLLLCPPFFLLLRLCLREKREKTEEAQSVHLCRMISYRQCLEMMSYTQKSTNREKKETNRRRTAKETAKGMNGFLENRSQVGARMFCLHDIMHLFWLSAVAWAWGSQAGAEKWKMEQKTQPRSHLETIRRVMSSFDRREY